MDRRRLHYLRLLGVDVYIPREAALEEIASVSKTQGEECNGEGPQSSLDAACTSAQGAAARQRADAARLAVARPAMDRSESARSTADRPTADKPTAENPAAENFAADRPGDTSSKSVQPAAGRPEGYPALPEVAGYGWEDLEQAVAVCRSCKLCTGRSQTVFGVGDRQADLVLVGEGPGAEEDRLGEPFVGRAGKLLDAMLAAIDRGRERGGVYICNIVKCRPPGNRDPRPEEVEACSVYLRRQLELLEPRLIVALGRVAAQRLLASNAPLAKLRGQTHTYADTTIPVWVTYHPAYLLRSPGEKAKSWQDLKQIRAAL